MAAPVGSVQPKPEEEQPAVMGVIEGIKDSVGAFVGNTPWVRGVRAMFHAGDAGAGSDNPNAGMTEPAANSAFAAAPSQINYLQQMQASTGPSQYGLNPSMFGEDKKRMLTSVDKASPFGT
jgi:hypothetical protein